MSECFDGGSCGVGGFCKRCPEILFGKVADLEKQLAEALGERNRLRRFCEAQEEKIERMRPMSEWRKIETAPKDKSILLAKIGMETPMYCGRYREGNGYGEPQSSHIAWRCDSSGRFANPTHWMPLPESPQDTK